MGIAVAIASAWLAGAGLVRALWPARAPLPLVAWIGLAGLVGPAAVGAVLLCSGAAGAPAAVSVPVITIAAITTGVIGIWRHRRSGVPGRDRQALLVVVLVLSIAWCGWLASRTHLGWDGTVLWYHKARIIAASDGAFPTATVADHTRSWIALDYPLQVPLAMAWVRLAQPVEDERTLKALPAAWSAALLCVVAGAVLERSGRDARRGWRAMAAVLVIASAPRLLIGEGSLTSGYADGPIAALLAALTWMAWRSDWGTHREWWGLMALLAACLAWTKQEGLIAVAAVAGACVWPGRSWSRGSFALPALAVSGFWQAWVVSNGAPPAMAYAWPGVAAAIGRLPVIARAYFTEATAFSTWGLLWPGLLAALGISFSSDKVRVLLVLLAIVVAGATAFVFSAWPDVSMHLQVTTGRQLLQVIPSLAIVAFSADSCYRR